VAAGGVVDVPEEFVAGSPQLVGLVPGQQFGSRVVSDRQPCRFDPYFIDRIRNRFELAQVIVLDTMFCNMDRHDENLLLVFGESEGETPWRFYMIDHSHCFENAGFSSPRIGQIVDGASVYENALTLRVACESDVQLEVAVQAAEMVPDKTIEALVEAVPFEWELTTQESVRIGDFIKKRRDGIRAIMDKGKSW
jgi:hypothetical protein